MIGVIDYGAGNLKSIGNACRKLGYETTLVRTPEELDKAEKIILPGVGNFGQSMQELMKYRDALKDKIKEGVPFLGICLGIQVILEKSDESTDTKGLGLLKGRNIRLPDNVKIPHMGWNNINIVKETPLLNGIPDKSMFYFVHSYIPQPKDRETILATTEYGIEFPSIIGRENIYATQFHPEKSGETGLNVLKNYLEL